MTFFRVGVVTGMTVGSTLVSVCLWNRPYYGLFSGMIHSAIAIGIRELFGKKVSALYIAGVVVYSVGMIGREILKNRNKNTTSAHSLALNENEKKLKSTESQGVSNLDANSPLAVRIAEIKKFPCSIARVTGIATAEGFYTSPSGKKIPLRSGAQLLKGSRAIPNAILESPMKSRYEKSEIVVIEQDCLVAAEEELKNGAIKVAVLMLASPIEPGGAMEEGNNGQEEELCRRSDIFGFMWDQAHAVAETSLYALVDLKEAHEKNPQYSSMTINRMIHVPQVTVFPAAPAEQFFPVSKIFLS